MKIWKLGYSERIYTYKNFSSTHKYVLDFFNSEYLISDYKTIEIEDRESFKNYDITRITPEFFVVSKYALEVLQKCIENKTNIFPLKHDREGLFAMHVNHKNNCLDYQRSYLKKLEGKDWIETIFTFSFMEERLMNETIFILPNYASRHVFVTDQFRQVVLDNKLTGFEFEEVWDSEAIPEGEPAEEAELIFEGEEYSFDTVLKMLDEGSAFANKDNKVQLDQEGNLLIGMYLGASKGYHWVRAVYFPPGFLEKKWYKVEREEMK